MNRLIPMAFTLVLAGSVLASGNGKKQTTKPAPVKLAIHHADPWAVKALIEGSSLTQPEISTIMGVTGQGRQNGNAQQTKNSPLLQDGYLVVNPTDNSLWWYPNPSK